MKNLTTLLLAGSLTLGAISGNGCAPMRQFPQTHIRNYEFQDRTQAQTPYLLERAILHGQDYYTTKLQQDTSKTNSLPFIISLVKDNTIVHKLNSRTTELRPTKEYIPVIVELENYDSTKNKDKWVDEIQLKANYSRGTEIQGIKAKITSLDELRKRKLVCESYGWSIVTDERDARYSILTIKINGKEYFFPHTERSKSNDEFRLPFYLIPKDKAEIKINPNGTISIFNRNNIFRPVLREHAEIPETSKYLGINLFSNPKHPNAKYYIISEEAFKEYKGKIEPLCSEQTTQLKNVIESMKIKNQEESSEKGE